MKKISFIAAALLAVIMTSCGNGTPKADMKGDIDSLCYAIGMSNSRGIQDYLAMQMGIDSAYMDDFVKGLNEGSNVEGDKKKLAYYTGIQIGRQVASQMVAGLNQELFGEDSAQYVSKNNIMAGFVAGTLNDTTFMKMTEAQEYVEKNIQAIKSRQVEKQYAPNKEAGEKFMAEVAKKEGIKQIEESGVYYEVITEGAGQIPADTSFVQVKYEGTLIDGTVFDGNMDQEKPMTFRCNQVIPGWTMALTHMPAGSKWKVYIPQEMAYGEREAGDKIKPFSTLVFVIDLVSVGK
jgi:FKBP-type peptidyl-prolyl cis-trans isomerase FklB